VSTIYGRKHTIRRGFLLVPQSMTGPGGKVYEVDLEYQVWDAETGRPVEDSRTLEGELQGSRLLVGDPHRDTRLYEYTVATQPTSESSDSWKGFRAALGDRQWHVEGKSKKYYGQTRAWWDGYNQGHREKRDPSAGYTPNAGSGGLEAKLLDLRPALAAAAQGVLNEWEQNEDGIDEEFGEGGACDTVANEMGGVLAQAGIDVTEGGHDGDDHAYLIAYDDEEAFVVDIPPGTYETGGGYRWRKRPNVRLQEDDVVVERINRSDIEPDMHENPRLRHTSNARIELTTGQRLETRGVLAGAYRGRGEERTTHTHAVVVDDEGRDVRVLCPQPLDHIVDSCSDPQGSHDAPTCPRCLPRWQRLRGHTPNGKLEMFNPRVDESATRSLRTAKLRASRGTDLSSAAIAAGNYAKSQGATCYVYQGNSNMHLVHRATPKKSEALSPINNIGDSVLEISPDLTVTRWDVRRPEEHTPNAPGGYYVWVLLHDGTPKDEGPYGPMGFVAAKDYARIAAQNGTHDRAVSIGLDPAVPSFHIARHYRRGTGERIS